MEHGRLDNGSVVDFNPMEDILDLSKEGLEYSDEVNSLVKERNDIIFNSYGEEQAAIVMSYLFLNSKESVRIFARSFSGAFSNHSTYLSSLEKFLKNKNNKIYVLLEENPSENSKALSMIKNRSNKDKNNTNISLLTSKSRQEITTHFKDNKLLYFSVADDDKYRIETNSGSREAFGSFDQKEVGFFLKEIYDKAFKTAKPILV